MSNLIDSPPIVKVRDVVKHALGSRMACSEHLRASEDRLAEAAAKFYDSARMKWAEKKSGPDSPGNEGVDHDPPRPRSGPG